MSKLQSPEPLAASLITVTQTAVGCGLGLLLADKLEHKTRKNVALGFLSIGVLAAIPLITEYLIRQINRPESARGMKKRLDSIRDDAGVAEDAEVF